jgi:LysR family transcriptional regulator, glycine cleavage system transcriptional activator
MRWMPPSLSAARAFEAAARTLNFTHAAEELGQTQGAISHQIRELEARLGIRLFERGRRGLQLTEAGLRYLPFVREALDRLRAGEELLRGAGRATVLTVSVSPNFASKWLIPRLGQFSQTHADLDLRISASTHHVDLSREDIDLAVRHGNGSWPELDVTRLCAEEMFPVCSPAYLKAGRPLTALADLANHVLIHDRDPKHWRDWLLRFGIKMEGGRGPVFDQTALAIDAAVSGQGVALARSALAALDLAAGRLVRPLPQAVPAEFAYWIVSRKSVARLPKIKRFRGWLIEQAQADAAGLSRKVGAVSRPAPGARSTATPKAAARRA